MSILIKYKNLDLTFDHMPNAEEIQKAYEIAQSSLLFKQPKQDSYAFSYAQQQIWFQEQVNPDTATFNIPLGFYIHGILDVQALSRALDTLLERHEILRSKIKIIDDNPHFYYSSEYFPKLSLIDLQHLDNKDRDYECERRKNNIVNIIFNLKRDFLFKFELIKKNNNCHLFLAVFHHLIIDQQSLDIFVNDLFDLYYQEKQLDKLELGFHDFVAWEKKRNTKKEQEILQKRFSGELPILEIFTDYPRVDTPRFQGGFCQQLLDPKLALNIRQSASSLGCSPYVLALSALAFVLHRYNNNNNNNNNLIIGSPFAGRTDPRLQHIMGLFVNMQPIRLDMKEELTFQELVSHTRERVFEAEANQNYPLLKLLGDLPGLEREAGRMPLFQIIFTYQTETLGAKNLKDLEITPVSFEPTSAKFDISFTFLSNKQNTVVAADFRSDLFEASTIENLLEHWIRILKAICEDSGMTCAQVSLLSPLEHQELIYDVNRQPTHECLEPSVNSLVENIACLYPHNIAIRHGDQKLSYSELRRRANFYAHKLKENVTKQDIIILFFDRSPEAVIAMLAVLKAGAAYLPLDPNEPLERLRSIIADCGAQTALCQQRYEHLAISCKLVAINGESKEELEEQPPQILKSDDIMNVLYTSGSTGSPKGVVLSHRGIMRLLHEPNFINLDNHDVIAQLCPLNFDGATFEIWGALTSGASLVIINKEQVLSPAELGNLICTQKITTLIVTTPLLNRLIEDMPQALIGLKNIVFGGEIISKPHMLKALEYCEPGALIHTYGPTENSFTSCFFRIKSIDNKRWTIPIGQPVSKTSIYVLDEHLRPVPFGVVGEIYLSGEGLALGYLNDTQKTRESFVANPFGQDIYSQRMYRTGDRGRRLRTGLIEFVGRKDNQIKIRSQRVELGEVEQALRKNPLVAECFVTVINNKQIKQLVAYFVPVPSVDLEQESLITDIRRFMQQLLPDYMIPTYFVRLSALPLNENGKVKRNALPPPRSALGSRAIHEDISILEKKIYATWQEVLDLKDMSVLDNFFDVGGHSLAIVKLQSAIERVTHIRLPIADFFKYTTIQAQAQALSLILDPHRANSSYSSSPEVLSKSYIESADNQVAIIGMAIRAPKANNIYEYWDNLREARDCITLFSKEEADATARALFAQHGSAWVRAGGLLDDVYGFDPAYFSLSDYDARRMDPQMRILLECVADALDNAALDRKARQAPISLYVGATPNTYGQENKDEVSGSESLVTQAMSHSVFMATRISHNLNLRGESIMIDTLCSTSLVAVHMAATSLLTHTSDYALAGGVTIQTPQKVGYLYEPNFIMSPYGQCRAFDAEACGTVPGNGAGVVLMKRLSDALRDQDPIYAVIRGSATNNDGQDKMGYYAPSVRGQAQAIHKAHNAAQICPDTISYIEAHGTATKLGDPIEFSALTEAFRVGTSRTNFCGLGSVKTNIGHLGNAAGIAGLIKTVLALKNNYIPASLNFSAPNPNIDFANSPFFVTNLGQPWQRDQTPRRAGVSSFGIGGTNAHVILEEAP